MSDPYLSFSENHLSNVLIVGTIRGFGKLCQQINYRGFYRIAKLIGQFVDVERTCILRMADDTYYCFHLADPYWNRLVDRRYHYEPEIESTLQLLKNMDYMFLDLGANYGYWSCRCTSQEFGAHNAIAVEPVAKNFEMLSRNWILNGQRFSVLRKAVTKTGEEWVTIQTDPRSISNACASVILSDCDVSNDCTEKVPSISIDDLITRQNLAGKPLIIKLDIEGMEIDALQGAKDVLTREVLLIYEDHGSDARCQVTEYVLDLGWEVFHAEGGGFTQVTCVDDVRAIKKQKGEGYNLFAFRKDTEFAHAFENVG